MPNVTPILRNRLRAERSHRRLSQDELAALAGVTRQTISSIENYQYVPSAQLAFLLAARLDVEIGNLFFLEEGRDD